MEKLTDTTKRLVEIFGKFYDNKGLAAYHLQFLTDNDGLTMTSANTLKNAASAAQQRMNQDVFSLRAHNSYVRYEGADVSVLEVRKVGPYELRQKIGNVPSYHSLSAWLGEAISAKNTLLDILRAIDLVLVADDPSEYLEASNSFTFDDFEYDEFDHTLFQKRLDEIIYPAETKEIDEKVAFTMLFTSAQYAKYLSDDARAAVIGKYIHQGGPLYALHNTSSVLLLSSGEYKIGDKSYPVQHKLLYDEEELERYTEYYEELRKMWRDLESSVNWYKAQVKDYISKTFVEDNEQYQKDLMIATDKSVQIREEFRAAKKVYDENRSAALAKYNSEKGQALSLHNSRLNDVSSRLEAKRSEYIQQVSKLRIFVPEPLREVVQGLQNN